MAKALFGHVGQSDPRLVAEVRRLTRRVRELEIELARVRTESLAGREGLTEGIDELAVDDAIRRMSVEEPALT